MGFLSRFTALSVLVPAVWSASTSNQTLLPLPVVDLGYERHQACAFNVSSKSIQKLDRPKANH